MNWRSGLGGFIGSSKQLIGGVFSFSHAVTTIIIEPPDIVDGVVSTMTQDGFGTTGLITSDGDGIISTV